MGMGKSVGMEMGLGMEGRWYGIEPEMGTRIGVEMRGRWE